MVGAGAASPALPCLSTREAPLVLRHRLFSCREILKEDESGSLKATIEDILFKAKRKRYSACSAAVALAPFGRWCQRAGQTTFGLAPSADVTVPGKEEK